jgi:cobalt-zinc-cadmium efflux system protein
MPRSHDAGHGRDPGRAFPWVIALNAGYVLIEALFGFWIGSLALLADAAHNLTDVLGLLLAWGAIALARLRPNERHTYGFGRATILAALVNGVLLLIGVGVIAREAIERIGAPQDVSAATVLGVAGVGVVVNTASALLLMKGQAGDLNVRGAFLHMAADAAVSVGVVLSAVLILVFGWTAVDPIAALLVSAVVGWSAFGLIRSALHLAMEGVPETVDRPQVEAWLRGLPGVADLHDLHIWAISTTSVALTVHLVVPDGRHGDAFLVQAARELESRFGIGHATIQIERGTEGECRLDDDGRP